MFINTIVVRYLHASDIDAQGGIPTVSFIGSGPKFDRPSTKKKGIFLRARTNDADFLQMEKGRYES